MGSGRVCLQPTPSLALPPEGSLYPPLPLNRVRNTLLTCSTPTTYTNIHMNIHLHTYTHVHMQTHTNVCTCIQIHTYTHMHTLFHSLPLPCLGGHFQIAVGEHEDLSPEYPPPRLLFFFSLFFSSFLFANFFLPYYCVCVGTHMLYEHVHVKQLCRVSSVFSPLCGSGD